MELVPFCPEHGRAPTSVSSESASFVSRAGGGATVACVDIAPGRRIAGHAVTGRRPLAVLGGTGTVGEADDIRHRIAAGGAAVCEARDEHETRGDEGPGTRFGLRARRREVLLETETRTQGAPTAALSARPRMKGRAGQSVPPAPSFIPNRALAALVVERARLALHGRP